MVKLSVTKDGTIVSVEKAVEPEIIDFIKKYVLCEEETSYGKRIDGWMKDFHISDSRINESEKTLTLVRELNENSKNVDMEMLAQAMRDIMRAFVIFVKSMIAEDAKPIKKFFHLEETESGLSMEGNISPMTVVAAIFAAVIEMAVEKALCDEDKDN